MNLTPTQKSDPDSLSYPRTVGILVYCLTYKKMKIYLGYREEKVYVYITKTVEQFNNVVQYR